MPDNGVKNIIFVRLSAGNSRVIRAKDKHIRHFLLTALWRIKLNNTYD